MSLTEFSKDEAHAAGAYAAAEEDAWLRTIRQESLALAEDFLVYSRIPLLDDRVRALANEIASLVIRHSDIER